MREWLILNDSDAVESRQVLDWAHQSAAR